MENENIVSTLTDGKIKAVSFGESIPEFEFDVDEWNKCYGSNRSENTKRLEEHYRAEINRHRIKNGFEPI